MDILNAQYLCSMELDENMKRNTSKADTLCELDKVDNFCYLTDSMMVVVEVNWLQQRE